ncbi:YlzJ-like family protein [Robertmurraya massiliosenegalensis]|uniref:YlzJ-like family protein n=1 Tax=Robertmurraya massiliosenegalensis TaxID=1287657 RepID=UPI0003031286|nr:YlzJ-like family protein [Robertmurraya massiliosenegalensis]
MILYTMMPQELIFPSDENEFARQIQVLRDGIPLIVEETEDNKYRVVRNLSSDPNHYLDQRYTPGAMFSMY